MDPTGTRADTIGLRRVEPTPFVRVGDRDVMIPPPIQDDPLVRWSGLDSIVVERPVAERADRGTFTLTQVLSGDTIFRRVFRYRPVPVSAAERDGYVGARIATPIRLPALKGGACRPTTGQGEKSHDREASPHPGCRTPA